MKQNEEEVTHKIYYNMPKLCNEMHFALTIIDYIKLYDYKNDDEKSDANSYK